METSEQQDISQSQRNLDTPLTPSKSGFKLSKRLRSPAHVHSFLASPATNRKYKQDVSFTEGSEIDILSKNLFGLPSTPKKTEGFQYEESVLISDRYLPFRSSLENEDIEEDEYEKERRGKENKTDSIIVGITGTEVVVSPSSQPVSPNHTDNSPVHSHSDYTSLLQAEMLGIHPSTPSRLISRHPATPSKPISKRPGLFRYKQYVSEVEREDRASHSLSPLTMFNTITERSELYSSGRNLKRKINKTPFKILDAPKLKDDYYLNLIDWSSTNILSAALETSVYLWNASTTKVTKLCDFSTLREFHETKDTALVTSVCWSAEGDKLAIGTNSGLVHIWDIESEKRVRSLSGHELRVGSLSWSHGSGLASGSRDRSIRRRDVRVGDDASVYVLKGHKQEVCGLRWNSDGSQLASGGNDNRLLVWDCNSDRALWKFANHHTAAVKAVAWSPHEKGLLASGGGTADKCIKFWNTSSGENTNSIDTGSQVCNMVWSKHSNELVSTHGYSLNQMIVWKYPTMSKIATLTAHTSRVLYLAMSPEGETVVTGAGDERLCFWKLFPGLKEKNQQSLLQSSALGFDIR